MDITDTAVIGKHPEQNTTNYIQGIVLLSNIAY